MIGRTLLTAATLVGLATLGAAARGDAEAPNLPPTIAMAPGTVNGAPALCIDVVDPDGAGDLLGYGYEYMLDTGKPFGNSLAITLWVIGKKGLTVTSIEGGKRLCFTKLPGNVTSVKVTATDGDWHQAVASAAVPSAVTAGQPKFGVPVKPPPKKK